MINDNKEKDEIVLGEVIEREEREFLEISFIFWVDLYDFFENEVG